MMGSDCQSDALSASITVMSTQHLQQDHPHDHHHHHFKTDSRTRLLLPFVLTLVFAIVEALGGLYTGSLALLGDAGHMISDSAALGLAWLASWIAQRPQSARHNFGLVRMEVLVAVVNALLMMVVIVEISIEAWHRLHQPHSIVVGEMMLIALLGLLINVFVAWYLHRDQDGKQNINQRAALLHVLGDLLGSLAALLAGAVIYFTGWVEIDAVLSLLIVLLIAVSSIRLLREGIHVLMEGVPLHLNHDEILQHLRQQKDVLDVHDLRIWAISSDHIALTAHIKIADLTLWPDLMHRLQHELADHFGVHHIVLQPEWAQTNP